MTPLDLNHPISSEQQADKIIRRAERRLKSVEGLRISNQPAPSAYICLTNISDHYFLESPQAHMLAAFYGFKITDFAGTVFPSIRVALRAREKHGEIFALMRSMEKHSHIPATFDGELPSVAFSDGQLPHMQIGQIYLVPNPDGQEVPARLTSATVDTTKGEMILAFHDPRADRAWFCRAPMSKSELDDYNKFPDTFFGVYHQQVRRAETPMELFDHFYESYKNTPKEKLLEFLGNASDFAELEKLSQRELGEILYCERLVYGIMGSKSSGPGGG